MDARRRSLLPTLGQARRCNRAPPRQSLGVGFKPRGLNQPNTGAQAPSSMNIPFAASSALFAARKQAPLSRIPIPTHHPAADAENIPPYAPAPAMPPLPEPVTKPPPLPMAPVATHMASPCKPSVSVLSKLEAAVGVVEETAQQLDNLLANDAPLSEYAAELGERLTGATKQGLQNLRELVDRARQEAQEAQGQQGTTVQPAEQHAPVGLQDITNLVQEVDDLLSSPLPGMPSHHTPSQQGGSELSPAASTQAANGPVPGSSGPSPPAPSVVRNGEDMDLSPPCMEKLGLSKHARQLIQNATTSTPVARPAPSHPHTTGGEESSLCTPLKASSPNPRPDASLPSPIFRTGVKLKPPSTVPRPSAPSAPSQCLSGASQASSSLSDPSPPLFEPKSVDRRGLRRSLLPPRAVDLPSDTPSHLSITTRGHSSSRTHDDAHTDTHMPPPPRANIPSTPVLNAGPRVLAFPGSVDYSTRPRHEDPTHSLMDDSAFLYPDLTSHDSSFYYARPDPPASHTSPTAATRPPPQSPYNLRSLTKSPAKPRAHTPTRPSSLSPSSPPATTPNKPRSAKKSAPKSPAPLNSATRKSPRLAAAAALAQRTLDKARKQEEEEAQAKQGRGSGGGKGMCLGSELDEEDGPTSTSTSTSIATNAAGGGSKSVKGPLEVGEGEYKQAPTFIRMQVTRDVLNEAIDALNAYLSKDTTRLEPLPMEGVLEVIGMGDKSRTVLLSLIHLKRLDMSMGRNSVRTYKWWK